jgi:DNA-binding protein H-NS
MARNGDFENMSYAELTKLQADIERMKIAKQSSERAAVKQKLSAIAADAGFDVQDLFGKGRKGKGTVAAKYRDPKNPMNTWTGRGRMPRWMTAAKKEDFLIG